MSEANSGMTLHSSVLTSDSFSCNCNSINSTCQLPPKSNSHISQSFVASVYKPVFFQCYSLHHLQLCAAMYPDIYQNKFFNVHTYILRLSHSKLHCVYPALEYSFYSIQYSTWCQNRGCSYISSRRRIYRSNPAVSCISPSILNISTVELQFY